MHLVCISVGKISVRKRGDKLSDLADKGIRHSFLQSFVLAMMRTLEARLHGYLHTCISWG